MEGGEVHWDLLALVLVLVLPVEEGVTGEVDQTLLDEVVEGEVEVAELDVLLHLESGIGMRTGIGTGTPTGAHTGTRMILGIVAGVIEVIETVGRHRPGGTRRLLGEGQAVVRGQDRGVHLGDAISSSIHSLQSGLYV
jgi:hypothetical protein